MKKIFIDACCGLSGGGFDYAVEILSRADREEKIICFVESPEIIAKVSERQKTTNLEFRVRAKYFGYRGIEDLWRFIILPLYVSRTRPDVFVSFSGIVSPLIIRPKKISLIHNILPFHDLAAMGWSFSDRLTLFVRRALLVASINNSDRVLTFSKDAVGVLAKYARGKEISCVLHSSKFISSVDVKPRPRFEETHQVSIFINSSCMPHKNLGIAVKGIILFLARTGRPVSVSIAGNVQNARYTNRFVRLCEEFATVKNLSIQLLGYLEHGELASMAQKADICISPSLIEIFDIGCLDNLYLCGRVCVSDIAVHREIFGGCEGIQFFKSTDPISLAQALETTLNCSPCEREATLDRFGTWDNVATKTWRLINE